MNQQTEKIRIKEKEDEMEIDLLELFRYYRGRMGLIILVVLAGVLIAGLVTVYLITPRYTAMAKLYMVSASRDSIVDLTDLNIGTSLSTDYEQLLRVRPIFEKMIEKENLPYTYEQLLGMVTISTITDTRILTISAESTKPDEAKRIANCLAGLAVSELPRLMDTSKPNIAEEAILPAEKSSPNLTRNVVIGGMGALVLVLGILTFLYITDDTMKSAEDVEKEFGIMPLTVIPEGNVESISDDKEREIRRQKKRQKKEKVKR